MAKMGSGTGLRKIALSQIVDTGNVRFDYRDIEELAESIKKNGQLEPVLVKALETDADGIEKFELIAGHRRLRAVQHLCESGESFTTIDAIVVTGDKLTLQLVENLQRSDLTAAERESGIWQMYENGLLSQKEVAARISKTPEYVSRNISAYLIRMEANDAGIDTSGLATATLNEIQAAEREDCPALVKSIIENGGTLESARAVMEEYRVAHGKPANPKAAKPAASPPVSTHERGISDPLGLHPSPALDPLEEHFGGEDAVDIDLGEPALPPPETPAERPAPKPKSAKPAPARSWLDEFEPPPHKEVDFNSVCLLIAEYAKKNEAVIKDCKVSTCEACNNHCPYFYNREAAHDIIALLHSKL